MQIFLGHHGTVPAVCELADFLEMILGKMLCRVTKFSRKLPKKTNLSVTFNKYAF